MREPHRGVQERLPRRPLELPPFPGQRLPPAAACRRLQPGQLLPPAVASALAFGTDRNSARPTLQNRRPHSSDRSLHPRSPRHRLAISSSVSPCRAGCEHHLIVSLCFRIHSARCFWRSLVQKVALSPLRVSRSVPAHLVRFPDTQSTSKSCADSRTLSSHELSRLSFSLSGTGNTCAVSVTGHFSGVTHHDKQDFFSRIKEMLKGNKTAAGSGPPAKN